MTEMWVERLITDEQGVVAWQPQYETFDLEADFNILEDQLTTEICRMGTLLVRYGSIAAEQMANLKRIEEKVKLVEAQVAFALRSDAESGVNKRKLTEAGLKTETTIHPNYQQALSALHILRADSAKADHWWRSAVKKADLLNAMAFMQNSAIKRGLE